MATDQPTVTRYNDGSLKYMKGGLMANMLEDTLHIQVNSDIQPLTEHMA